jgi:hypothetical protein
MNALTEMFCFISGSRNWPACTCIQFLSFSGWLQTEKQSYHALILFFLFSFLLILCPSFPCLSLLLSCLYVMYICVHNVRMKLQLLLCLSTAAKLNVDMEVRSVFFCTAWRWSLLCCGRFTHRIEFWYGSWNSSGCDGKRKISTFYCKFVPGHPVCSP